MCSGAIGRETKADADIANVLTMDEARRIASNIAKLPRLIGHGMRRHGDRLTNACIAALVSAGEVSQAEVNRRRAALGR